MPAGAWKELCEGPSLPLCFLFPAPPPQDVELLPSAAPEGCLFYLACLALHRQDSGALFS
jgi:hypothetical protein